MTLLFPRTVFRLRQKSSQFEKLLIPGNRRWPANPLGEERGPALRQGTDHVPHMKVFEEKGGGLEGEETFLKQVPSLLRLFTSGVRWRRRSAFRP